MQKMGYVNFLLPRGTGTLFDLALVGAGSRAAEASPRAQLGAALVYWDAHSLYHGKLYLSTSFTNGSLQIMLQLICFASFNVFEYNKEETGLTR